MTNEEAREALKELKMYSEDLPHYSSDEVAEAIDMAFKALKYVDEVEKLFDENMDAVFNLLVKALRGQQTTDEDIKKYLADRPCDVCVFHKEEGCSKWSCVFEE